MSDNKKMNNNPGTFDESFVGWIGVSHADITPSEKIYFRNWGAGLQDTPAGIHRPLTLTCMTFRTKKRDPPLVLISADLGVWKRREDEESVRLAILREFHLNPRQLMFCLSHTHAGPSLFPEDSAKPGGEFISGYLVTLRNTAVTAVRQALKTAVVSTLSWRYGKCDLARNRDLKQTKSNRYVVGYNPGEHADDTLLVGRITDESGKSRGTIVNYACHPTTLAWANQLLSPDYVGAMRDLIENVTGSPCLFLQGASGDMAPAEQYSGSTELADKHGRQLGYAVLSVLESMYAPRSFLYFSKVVESGAPLGVWQRRGYTPPGSTHAKIVEVEVALKPLPPLREIEEEWLTCTDRVTKERLWRLRGVRKAVGTGASTTISLWLWRLGRVILAGQPNEAYAQYQVQLRKALAPLPVVVINLVNGSLGYLPPKQLYGHNIYSVNQTPYAAGSLEHLQEVTISESKKIIA